VERRPAAAKKGGAKRLIQQTVEEGQRRGVIDGRIAAIDATGMDADRKSQYYSKRSGRRKRRFPKVSAVVDTVSHMTLSLVTERGPKADDTAMHEAVGRAHQRVGFKVLLADAGYDAEHHHEHVRDDLRAVAVIPPKRGRPAKDPAGRPHGRYRRFMHDAWAAMRSIYGQRWQVETRFSMTKRRLGPAVRARTRHAIDREMRLGAITLNIMILAAAAGF